MRCNDLTKPTNTMHKILFVCHGNICRSPMAEWVMKTMVKDAKVEHLFEIDSAATSREEIGNPIYPPAQRCLYAHGIRGAHHEARQVTAADYDHYDHIILMDHNNLRNIRRIIPSDPEGKIRLLMSLVGKDRDVADPWYTGDFEATYSDVLEGCRKLLEMISGHQNK